MPLRVIAWNCRSGSLSRRLAELAPLAPDLAFVQECRPAPGSDDLPVFGQVFAEPVDRSKSVALAGFGERYRLTRVPKPLNAGRAVIAATVEGPLSFNLLGIWAIGPRYTADVCASLAAYDNFLHAAPTLIIGDLNCGPSLSAGDGTTTRGHAAFVKRIETLGFVSAYHAFHRVPNGAETHASYRHRFAEHDLWHIDFCFLPASWVPRLERVDSSTPLPGASPATTIPC